MNTDRFIYTKKDDIYQDIAGCVETIFDTSNYEFHRPLPKRKKKKLIRLMKGELGEKIMKKFVRLRGKTYSYLIDDDSEDKKAKGTKKVCHKKRTQI